MIASFIVHWIIFIPSFLAKTEKFYDITGTLAYIIILYVASVLTSYSSGVSLELRTKIIIGMVSFWAIRLGVFLFVRVLRVGEDRRFREAKKSFSKYLVWWTMSGLWVFLTTANALTLIINNKKLDNKFLFYLFRNCWGKPTIHPNEFYPIFVMRGVFIIKSNHRGYRTTFRGILWYPHFFKNISS